MERIRLIRRTNSCALIEFTTATFACLARNHLDGTTLRGNKLIVTFSRYDRVRLPWESGLPDTGDTKEFSGPQFLQYKRYRTEELKKNNMRKITGPTSTVHISGIPVICPISYRIIFQQNILPRLGNLPMTSGGCLS